MKYKGITILLILTILSIGGCNKSNQKIGKFDKFPKHVNLKGEKTGLTPRFKIALTKTHDSLLLLTATVNNINTIHLYNKNTFQHILSTGKIGRGPGEIKKPGDYILNKELGCLLTADWGTNEIIRWSVDSLILQKKSYKPQVTYELPSSIWPPNAFTQLNDSTFLYMADNLQYYFYATDKKGNIIDSLNIKNNTNIYSNINRKELMGKEWYHHIIHPSKNRIIIAYAHADIVVGLDYEGNILFQRQGPDVITEDPAKGYLKHTYYSLKSTKKYVYGLYLGGHIRKKRTSKPSIYPKNIFVFNWKGKPIANLQLDHPIQSFDIDKENNTIVTYAADLGEVITYDLPSFLINQKSNLE